ncbi:MAG TPA: pyridoxamine 5'-phosphate oxidase [Herbaspirillum sp.]|nr:pyridoxamine 5'-phosphate oxidase [Herbaspirillum sp.]
MSIADLRKDYSRASLSELDVAPDPIAQFSMWLDEAIKAEIPEPTAMSVATVGPDGKPSSRIVLLKQIDAAGLTWFTNYHSRKGSEIAQHPYVALLFHWVELERQVRIEGKAERLAASESDAYFYSRPLASQLSAIASAQSQPVDRRETLEAQLAVAQQKYGAQPVRPEYWGGYRVVPEKLEFWQGRRSRLHDRVVYTRTTDGAWSRQRLQP